MPLFAQLWLAAGIAGQRVWLSGGENPENEQIVQNLVLL
jgi:hypothetical protein